MGFVDSSPAYVYGIRGSGGHRPRVTFCAASHASLRLLVDQHEAGPDRCARNVILDRVEPE